MLFKDYLNIIEQNTAGFHNDFATAAFSSSDFSGSETFRTQTLGTNLPSIDMIIPNVTRTAKIIHIEKNKNPIFVLLKDGTKLYFTWDQYIRIGKPEVGNTITATFEKYTNQQDQPKILKIEIS